MKRYMLFGGEEVPLGGFKDFLADADEIEDFTSAIKVSGRNARAVRGSRRTYDFTWQGKQQGIIWWQLVDSETKTIVEEGRFPEAG